MTRIHLKDINSAGFWWVQTQIFIVMVCITSSHSISFRSSLSGDRQGGILPWFILFFDLCYIKQGITTDWKKSHIACKASQFYLHLKYLYQEVLEKGACYWTSNLPEASWLSRSYCPLQTCNVYLLLFQWASNRV